MSRSKLQRTLCILAAAFVLALPLPAHQTRAETKVPSLERFIAALWERLATPLASLWKTGETTADTTGAPVDSDADDPSDSRAHIDPNG